VLSHPANWGPFRRALFEEVVRLGGLASAVTVTEPEAAATRYAASRKLGEGKLVAVYDLGGGTFDATVLRTTAAGMEIVGTPEGVERLGGIDFDEAILRYVDYTSESALTDLDLRDPPTVAALARLRQDCILAKETLSADTETVLPVFLPNRHFEVTLTRPMFEDLIRAQVESTIGALARTLDSARVSPAELDAVLLIGGSSRIPLVTTLSSTSRNSAASSSVAVNGRPPSTTGVGSPRRRLNSRATRSGEFTVRRLAAASPVTSVPSSRRNTADGVTSDRSPRVNISTRSSTANAAATKVVPRSTPRLYATRFLPRSPAEPTARRRGGPAPHRTPILTCSPLVTPWFAPAGSER
jgi:hypothetical protein